MLVLRSLNEILKFREMLFRNFRGSTICCKVFGTVNSSKPFLNSVERYFTLLVDLNCSVGLINYLIS